MEHGKNLQRDSVTGQPIDPGLRNIQHMNESVDLVGSFDALMKGFERSVREKFSEVLNRFSSAFSVEPKTTDQKKDGVIIPFSEGPEIPGRPAKPTKKKVA